MTRPAVVKALRKSQTSLSWPSCTWQNDGTTGGPGDKLHPNRLGYMAMGMSIDLDLLRPKSR